jgi:hypothetical protein
MQLAYHPLPRIVDHPIIEAAKVTAQEDAAVRCGRDGRYAALQIGRVKEGGG